ncbi:hypothetical protein A2960_01055 [Candidatus Gottesmanbacteria bacterium RIFCSPLOWO2_01_FULL_39_12b]|uniref:Glycosyl transferase family 1 domain-containing protein n=1 Tax=Candidatus Gottesmanbacteria bacterium RIFCSPLOWO2_01_FULL_39_12b TaxID=1798388 RepID=A0A1F6AQH7_9BACT|nr:MAG: hypothetical protein A2960_01055 [Candidatus Gottesmanbacteria bacterium RIFCSPLOWO2_01_FULL_39_12b]
MRLAIVYDRVNKFGGAERVLLALHELWPNAPLFTAVYSSAKAQWSNIFKINPSFLNSFSFFQNRHEILPFLTPFAFESFDFNDYDVVLSITSAEAKFIITKPETLHICYCLTPTRYYWSGYDDYLNQPGVGILNPIARLFMKSFVTQLRNQDFIAAQRPDVYIAISSTVANRISRYYKRKAFVIYPPVDIDIFNLNPLSTTLDYYLIVARLVPYKKIEYAISAFNKLGWKLKVIGNGLEETRLRNLAKSNIELISGDLTDKELGCYYQNCKALIFPGEEDFGLTAVEVQSCGRPVIAFRAGGACESVVSGVTGEFYDEPTVDALTDILKSFNCHQYLPINCRKNSKRFSKEIFKTKFKTFIENYISLK